MSLYASITTFPPLNKLTVLPPSSPASSQQPTTKLPVTTLLTTAVDRPRYPFIVHLHYHITPTSNPNPGSTVSSLPPPGRWASIALAEVDPDESQTQFDAGSQRDSRSGGSSQIGNVSVIGTDEEKKAEYRRLFRGELDLAELKAAGGGRVRLAVRYRVDPTAGWRWEEAKGGPAVADVLVPGSPPGWSTSVQGNGIKEVKELLGLVDDGPWVVNDTEAGEDGGGVFEVESKDTMPRVPDGEHAFGGKLAELALGKVKDQLRYMSIVRLEPYWLGVQHGMTTREWEGEFEQSMDGVLVAFLLKTGKVLVLLAVNGSEDVYTVIRSGKSGEIVVGARNDNSADEKWRILVAIGASVDGGIAKVMKEARTRVMRAPKMKELLKGADEILGRNIEMAKEDWFDGLAYCTWNGMDMHRCSEKGVLEGIRTLEDSGVNIQTFLLDDCWQTAKKPDGTPNIGAFNDGWDRFEPNQNFPRGLKAVIEEVKRKHKGIKNFGIWHALFGYWGGIAEGGWIDKNYKTRRVATKFLFLPDSSMLIVDPEDVERFYDDLYSWLKGEGVDFVKTDAQHMLSMLESQKDREEVPAAYQKAWTLAVMKHFNGKAISCMSQSPQTLFHSLLQDKSPKVMHRNSDDFFPDIVGSNPWHIYVNAFNALLDRHLNVVPDWDMYQTEHPWSGYHTAARAISGGPILITDIPGKHDTKLVEEMTGTSPSGALIALRPKPAAAIDHWERFADGNLCKIGTSTGEGKYAAGILGIFNIVEGMVSELISVSDFPSIETEEVMIKSQRTGQIFGPLKQKGGGFLGVTVAPRGYDILTAYPVHSGITAILGLQGKMSGAAAVVEQSVAENKVKMSLKAIGKLAGWTASPDARIQGVNARGKRVDDEYVSWVSHDTGRVFEIDLLKFWKAHNLWCDDEIVEVVIEFA